MTEDREVVERRDGVTVSVELKRGTGTRDQDKLSGTVHAEDMTGAVEKTDRLLGMLDETAAEARSIQPEADTEANDGD